MKKVLIVGAGAAGLSAGIYLAMNGLRVTIAERLPTAGGCLSAWDRKGYHIDNCVHWLTGTNPGTALFRMWRDLGVLGDGIGVVRRESLYTLEEGGERLSLKRDLGSLEKDLLRLSPDDEREIRSLCRVIEALQGLEGIAGPDHREKAGFLRLISDIPVLLRYTGLSVKALGERFRYPLIRRFLTSFMPDGFGALALLYTMAVFTGDDGDLPEGGSSAMAGRMTERFLALGGELLLEKDAEKVLLNGSRATSVVFRDQSEERFDHLILTADPAMIFGRLLDAPMPRLLQKQYRDPALGRFSAFHAAFAADLDTLPFSGDFVLSLPEDFPEEMGGRSLLLRNASEERGTAPPGKSLIQTMIYVDEETAERFIALRENDRAVYRMKKEELASAEMRVLSEHFPDLRRKLTELDIWTPATYRRYIASEIGSFMSFTLAEKHAPVSVPCRVPGLRNVFLAGQWLRMPGGLPMAAESGRRAAVAVLRAG